MAVGCGGKRWMVVMNRRSLMAVNTVGSMEVW